MNFSWKECQELLYINYHILIFNISERFINHTWAADYRTNRNILAYWLINNCVSDTSSGCQTPPNTRVNHVEYQGYDGWYNNLARPDSGAIGKYK